MDLTFKEFVEKAKETAEELGKVIKKNSPEEYFYTEPSVEYLVLNVVEKVPKASRKNHYRGDHYDYKETDSPHFYLKWEVGGASGGSCWGTEAEEYSCHAIEPKFKILDSFLTKVCPNLAFLKYKEIENFIKTDDLTDYEYYGNRTDYKVKFIDLKEIYNILKKQ